FHPDRMASRILGMGDVLTLIEKAEQVLDKTKAQELEKKIRRQEFSLEDFLVQLKELRKMGPVEEILNMLPGRAKSNINVDEKEIKKIEAIVLSMTREERDNPAIINASRRKRIARGSGTTVQDVNRLLKQFFEAKELVRQVQGRLPMKRQAKKFPFLK
ncbi:MAG: signal recognition particle protein, partial [Clostridia bacterium]|nr:signal recognition particle protein [Clostridia bacterium]